MSKSAFRELARHGLRDSRYLPAYLSTGGEEVTSRIERPERGTRHLPRKRAHNRGGTASGYWSHNVDRRVDLVSLRLSQETSN